MSTMNEQYNNVPILDGFKDPQHGQELIDWVSAGYALDARSLKSSLASVGLTEVFTQNVWEYFYPMELTAVTNILASRLARAYCSSAVYLAMLDMLLREAAGKADWADVCANAEAAKAEIEKSYKQYTKMWKRLENSFTKYCSKKLYPVEPSMRLEPNEYMDLRKAKKPKDKFDFYLMQMIVDINERIADSPVEEFLKHPGAETITRLYTRILPCIVYRMRLGLQINMLAYQYRWAEATYGYSAINGKMGIDMLKAWYPDHGKKAYELFFETCSYIADKNAKLDLSKQKAVDEYLTKYFGTSLGETRATRIEAMKPLYEALSDLGKLTGDMDTPAALFRSVLKLAE